MLSMTTYRSRIHQMKCENSKQQFFVFLLKMAMVMWHIKLHLVETTLSKMAADEPARARGRARQLSVTKGNQGSWEHIWHAVMGWMPRQLSNVWCHCHRHDAHHQDDAAFLSSYLTKIVVFSPYFPFIQSHAAENRSRACMHMNGYVCIPYNAE